MSKRIAIAAALVAAVVAVVLIASGGGRSSDGYVVRAVFDNGAFMVNGEQVRVAGANVGTIESVNVSMPGEHGRLQQERQAGIGPRQGDHRHEHHRSRLPGLPQRRQLPDPAAVADRREVRRLPPDPAAGARLAARRRR